MNIPVITSNGEVRYMKFDYDRYPPEYHEMEVYDLPPIPVAVPNYVLPPVGLISTILTWNEKYNPPPVKMPKHRYILLKLFEFGIAGTGVPFYLYVEIDRKKAFNACSKTEYIRNRLPMDDAYWPERVTRQQMVEEAPLYHRRMYQCDWVRSEPEPDRGETRPPIRPNRKDIKW